jgi:lipoprotein signal peptidase
MGLIVVIPMFYFIKYFEDGAGFSAMTNSMLSYAALAGIAVVVLFMISMIISIIGYSRKK